MDTFDAKKEKNYKECTNRDGYLDKKLSTYTGDVR